MSNPSSQPAFTAKMAIRWIRPSAQLQPLWLSRRFWFAVLVLLVILASHHPTASEVYFRFSFLNQFCRRRPPLIIYILYSGSIYPLAWLLPLMLHRGAVLDQPVGPLCDGLSSGTGCRVVCEQYVSPSPSTSLLILPGLQANHNVAVNNIFPSDHFAVTLCGAV